MSAFIHDPAVRAAIETRLGRLRADSKGVWGRMSVDQMLWHVNQAMATALGRVELADEGLPIPAVLVRFATLNFPWVRNAPTNGALRAKTQFDFSQELATCRALIADIVAHDIDHAPPMHPVFGQMTGRQQSRLHAKHLDHHLKQFGV
jgi:hypothetical protein